MKDQSNNLSLSTKLEDRTAQYTALIAEATALGKEALDECQRDLAKTDLYFLLRYVCARPDVERQWILDRCLEVQAEPENCLDLWARGHYKSTIITFAAIIQEILKNPEITICIMSHTRGIAKGFLRQIKRELGNNIFLRGLFPEILYEEPHRTAPKWSEDDGLVVKRKGNPKESTVEAWGLVDSQPTAKHYDLIVYDDVVTIDSVSTPEQINKTTESYELSLNLLSEHGRKRLAGTRYHLYDTYQEILKRGNIKARIYPGTHNGQVDGDPVLWTKKQMGEKRIEMGHATFACQILINPKADEVDGFEYNDLRFWDATNPGDLNLYIIVDAASKKKKTSDYTSIVVLGLGIDEGVYVVDIIRDRLNLEERGNKLFELHRQHKPINVGYEEYGMMADIEHMQYRMNKENYHFDIVALKGKTAKEDRIKKLLPKTKRHLFFLPRYCWHKNYEGRNVDVAQAFIQEEYVPFPYGSHDDILDSISRIIESAEEMAATIPNTNTHRSFKRMRAQRASSGASAWGA